MKKGRTLVVGDIHGANKALLQVLERSNFDPVHDQIIFLGDYVDGWSESAEVIETLIKIRKETAGNNPAVFLRGNHDKWCEDWLNTGVKHNYWLPQGGQATFDSYIRTSLVGDRKHAHFFTYLNNYYVDDKNRGFVHGGFVSRKGLGHEAHQANYYWDRDLWTIAMYQDRAGYEEPLVNKELSKDKVGKSSGNRFYRHKELYIGHTSTCNWKAKGNYKESKNPNQILNAPITVPMVRCNVWNMDTGGGFFGKLTIMDIDTKEYWQSDFVKELYPDEKGR